MAADGVDAEVERKMQEAIDRGFNVKRWEVPQAWCCCYHRAEFVFHHFESV